MTLYVAGQAITLSTGVGAPVPGTEDTTPVDPGDISLVLTADYGTPVTYDYPGQIVRDSQGNFHLDLPKTTPAGFYSYVWDTTGNAAGVKVGWFDVVAPVPELIGMADAVKELNISKGSSELQGYVNAANAEIRQRCGPVIPELVTEPVTATGGGLALSTRGVLSIRSATLGGSAVSIAGWTVSPLAGLVSATSRLYGDYVVTYLAGRDAYARSELRNAGLDIIQHKYSTQRGGGAGAGQIIGSATTDELGGGSGFLFRLRAEDVIKRYRIDGIA